VLFEIKSRKQIVKHFDSMVLTKLQPKSYIYVRYFRSKLELN